MAGAEKFQPKETASDLATVERDRQRKCCWSLNITAQMNHDCRLFLSDYPELVKIPVIVHYFILLVVRHLTREDLAIFLQKAALAKSIRMPVLAILIGQCVHHDLDHEATRLYRNLRKTHYWVAAMEKL
jgi:ABC-type cobalamin transport system ATPase subunit